MTDATEDVLHRWQTRLLELLRAGGDPAAIRSAQPSASILLCSRCGRWSAISLNISFHSE